MALSIGTGLQAWIQEHQATPLSDEIGFPPDNLFTGVVVQIADDKGQTVHTIVGWDLVNGEVMEPGPGTLAKLFTPADGLLQGLDGKPQVNVQPGDTVNPSTGQPAATDPLGIFVERLLVELDLSPNPARMGMIRAWASCEGGVFHNNPLNITAPLNGGWAWEGQTGFWNDLGTIGVVNFDNTTNAAIATAKVIRQSNMDPVLAALLAENPSDFVAALGEVPWGTDPTCVKSQLGV